MFQAKKDTCVCVCVCMFCSSIPYLPSHDQSGFIAVGAVGTVNDTPTYCYKVVTFENSKSVQVTDGATIIIILKEECELKKHTKFSNLNKSGPPEFMYIVLT